MPDQFEVNNQRDQATDLGQLQSITTRAQLSIDDTDEDWFRFETTQAGTPGAELKIEFDNSEGDLDLELYDANGTLLSSSDTTNDEETISLGDLDAGVYFARILGYRDESNPDYTLTITPPGVQLDDTLEENDTRDQATALGQLDTTPITRSDLKILSADADWFKFNLAETGQTGSTIKIDFQQSEGDLDLELYDAEGQRIDVSANTGNSELLGLAGRAAGDYYIRVLGYNGDANPNYALSITPFGSSSLTDDSLEENDTQQAATDLGQLQNTISRENLVIRFSDDDWFKFQTLEAGQAGSAIKLDFANEQGDIDLVLYDANGQLVGSSTSTNDGEQISLEGRATGVYYAQVSGYNGIENPNYKLTLIRQDAAAAAQNDRFEPNNDRTQAANLGQIQATQTFNQLTLLPNDVDWFRFETLATGQADSAVSLSFLNANGDIDLELYDAAGNSIALSDSSNDSEKISLDGRNAGVYYARVYNFGDRGNPSYTLSIAAPQTPSSTGGTGGTTSPSPTSPTNLSLTGTPAANVLQGEGGNDTLLGVGGNDTLLGSSGNDMLNGGDGADTLTGGAGADRFIFSGASKAAALKQSLLPTLDRITDFNIAEGDRLQLDFDNNLSTVNLPKSLFNAGKLKGGTLVKAVKSVYQDKNQKRRGNQAIKANEAVSFTWKGRSFIGINDNQAKFSASRDSLIEVTGLQSGTGSVQAGALAVNNYFA